MQPLATGSLQPLKPPKVDIRDVSPSAPELSVKPEELLAQRFSVFSPTLDNVKPERCDKTLLTPDHLIKLDSLSSSEGITFINSCLNENSPTQQAILLYTVYRWTKENNLDSKKTIVLITIYSKMLDYFLSSPWRSQNDIYMFFKECLLRNTIQHPPKSARIFSPDESKEILIYFCHKFLIVLPLLRLNCLPNNRIQISWTSSNPALLEEKQIQSHNIDDNEDNKVGQIVKEKKKDSKKKKKSKK